MTVELPDLPDTADAEEVGRRIAAETGGFTGGGVEVFADIGRFTLRSLIDNGLRPSHRLLDLGCGALRNGFWLVRYLDADRYFGIEPSKRYVEIGMKHAIGPQLAAEKRPRFDHNREFDLAAFGERWDFVVARSIFSHASPEQFRKAMISFRDNSNPEAVMLASYRPIPKRKAGQDFIDLEPDGPEWRYNRFYSEKYLQDMARECGVHARNYGEVFNTQMWLRVSRTDA